MDQRAIGVFDSGLGGLTAVRHLQNLLPNECWCWLLNVLLFEPNLE